jgi:hypothetical protein
MAACRPALGRPLWSPGDVIRAVGFARKHDPLVSVRRGGHNIAGNAVCEGGRMIDLSPERSPGDCRARLHPRQAWNRTS